MSFLGSVLGGVKNAVTGVGHAIGTVASNPLVQAGLGATLGPGAAALAGGLGHLIAPGGNLGSAAGGAVSGGLSGVAGGALRGALGGGVGGVLGAVKGAGGLMGGGGSPSAALGLGGGSDGGSGVSPAVMALAGLQAANAASLGKTANDYSDKAWNLANDSYTSRAGLRDAGIKGLLSPATHDLSGLSAIRGQNPVAAKAGAGAGPSAPSAPATPAMRAGMPPGPGVEPPQPGFLANAMAPRPSPIAPGAPRRFMAPNDDAGLRMAL